MTHRDPAYTPLSPLAPRIADALRNAGADGLTLREIEVQAGTRWALRVIVQMCRHGYNIGEQDDRYVLVVEPGLVGASDERRPAPCKECGPASAGTLGQASDAPTSPGRLFELPHTSHYTAEAA